MLVKNEGDRQPVNTTRLVEDILLEAELMNSAPEYVYTALKLRSEASERSDEEVELALLRRNSRLIDLGLARYGSSSKVIRRLFDIGGYKESNDISLLTPSPTNITGGIIRLAILANSNFKRDFPHVLFEGDSLTPKMDIYEFLKNADCHELKALFNNPTIRADFLASLYAKDAPFDRFDESKWQDLIDATYGNARLREAYRGDDSWAEYEHAKVFEAAWKLTETVPPSGRWAEVLSYLLDKTKPEA